MNASERQIHDDRERVFKEAERQLAEGRDGSLQHRDGERWPNGGRNIRSVWEIATQPYPDAHFATYPEELVRRCILAGCPEQVCGECGKPRERIVERGETDYSRLKGERDCDHTWQPQSVTGGQQSCTECERSCRAHDAYRPGIVLDPFGGSGTTALVARKHGRRSVLIELNEAYCRMAAQRLSQLSLLSEVSA